MMSFVISKKTSLESKQQIEALEQESDGLCRENAELRDKLAAAERERDKFASPIRPRPARRTRSKRV